MVTKKCTECKIEMPLSEFNVKVPARGTLFSKCKKCSYGIAKRTTHVLQTVGEKKCRICGEFKEIKNFAKASRNIDGREHQCKICRWQRRDKEKRYKNNVAIARFTKLQITQEYYNDMLKEQQGVCVICGLIDPKRQLSVDHDHQTGKIRGLLCNKCNRALGLFNDNSAILERAIKYLKPAE